MKKRLAVIMIILALVFTGCKGRDNPEALRFKEEYESLNGKSNASGRDYRNITIPKDNPFIYATVEEIVSLMEKGESFLVYFGANWCPWCRSCLNTFIETAKENKISQVYYVDVRPDNDETKEIRNVYDLDEEGRIYLKHEGTAGYQKFIELAAAVLADYSQGKVETLDGSEFAGEKRVGAPNFICVNKGKAVFLTEGVGEDFTDPYKDITDDDRTKMKELFTSLFEKYKEGDKQ